MWSYQKLNKPENSLNEVQFMVNYKRSYKCYLRVRQKNCHKAIK